MFQRIRTRITVISSAIVLGAGTLLAFGSGHAWAVNPAQQWCVSNGTTNACLNAWYGGPEVNVENTMGSVPNDEFSVNYLNNGNGYVEFVGGGNYNGMCIGDFENNSGLADTGLDQCPTNSNSGGWGTNFKISPCSSGEGTQFKNNHWGGGWLAPGGFGNGTSFYLNHSGEYCFGVSTPGTTE